VIDEIIVALSLLANFYGELGVHKRAARFDSWRLLVHGDIEAMLLTVLTL